MLRRLRHHVRGGWYHITTRGMGRREIFHNDRDRTHFLELLAEMVDRYGVIVRAMEDVKQESWKEFADRRGDWGRDLALYIGRRHSKMTLQALATQADLTPPAVGKAATRMRVRLSKDRTMRNQADQVLRLVNQSAKDNQ